MKSYCVGLLAGFLLHTAIASAQEESMVVIKGGRLFDSRAGVSRPLGQLWIRGDRVLGERAAGTPIPKTTRIVDARGCTTLPGLIDAHVHVSASGSFYDRRVPVAPERNLAANLVSGVTSVLDLFAPEQWIFALREPSRASNYPGPRIYAAGPALTAPGGHCTQMFIPTRTCASPEDAVKTVNDLAESKPDVLKIIFDDLAFSHRKMKKLGLDVVEAAILTARAHGIKVFVHITNVDDGLAIARLGPTALAHMPAFFGKATDEELIDAMKKNGVAVISTLCYFENAARMPEKGPMYDAPFLRDVVPGEVLAVTLDERERKGQEENRFYGADAKTAKQWRRRLAAMHAAGISIIAGTDAGNPQCYHGLSLIDEIHLLTLHAGMTPAEAIQSATSKSAKLLGLVCQYGTLERGRIADVLIVEGDPIRKITDLYNTKHVLKGGRLVSLKELHDVINLPKNLPVTTPISELIDDFAESGGTSSMGTKWTTVTDEVMGGNSTIRKSRSAEGHLVLEITLGDKAPWNAYFAGCDLKFTTKPGQAMDGSAYTGIQFRARLMAGEPRSLYCRIPVAAVKDWDNYQAEVKLSREWQEYRIPFTNLKQRGFGKRVEWTGKDLLGVYFGLYGKPIGTFAVELDDVSFYRKEARPIASGTGMKRSET